MAGIECITVKLNPEQFKDNNGLTRYKLYCYDSEGKLVKSISFKDFTEDSNGEFYFEYLKSKAEYTVKLERQFGSADKNTTQIIKSKKISTKSESDPFAITAELDHEAMTVTIKWEMVNYYRKSMYIYRDDDIIGNYFAYAVQYVDNLTEHDKTYSYYVRTYGGSIKSETVSVTVPPFTLPEVKTKVLDNCVEVSWKPFVKAFCSTPVKLYRNSIDDANFLLNVFVSDDVNKSDCSYLDCEAKAGDKYILVADDGENPKVESESASLTETFTGLRVYRKPSVKIIPAADKVTVEWEKDESADGYIVTVVSANEELHKIEISGNENNTHVFETEEFIDLEKGFQFFIQSVKDGKKGSIGDVFYAAVSNS